MKAELKPKLHIDKLRLVYAVDKADKHHYDEYLSAISFVKSMCLGSETKGAKIWKPHPKSSITYGSIPLETYGKEPLVVQFGYHPAKKYRICFEFNPDKFSDDGFHQLRTYLSMILHNGGNSLIESGAISMCEVSVDVDGVRFQDFHYFDTGLKSENTHLVEKGTLYLGSDKGQHSWCIYDKAKQLKEKEGIDLGHERLRIEKILHPHGQLLISEWHTLENRLTTLGVIDKVALEGPAGGKVPFLRYPMTQKKGYTAQRAFHTSTKSAKAQTIAALPAVTPAWWQPGLIWAGLPEALGWLGKLVQ